MFFWVIAMEMFLFQGEFTSAVMLGLKIRTRNSEAGLMIKFKLA